MKKHWYLFYNDMPFWFTYYYTSSGKLLGYRVRRWNGRFWLNTYRYETEFGKSYVY